MNWIIPNTVIFLLVMACQDNLKIKTIQRPKAAIVPEVSSTIEVFTDDTGTIRSEAKEGAVRYGAKILDAACDKELHDLGIQDKPDFSLPQDAYFKPLCLETTYYDAKNKVMEVKLQPFTFEGPKAIEINVARDNQVIDFPDVSDAASYTYIVIDANGQIKMFDSNLGDSLIDLKNTLTDGTYKLVILAQDSKGKNIKSINYVLNIKIENVANNLADNMHFERSYYQTRSIKRILLETGVLNDSVTLKVGEQELDTAIILSYSGGFGAVMDNEDAMMRSKLPYNGSSVDVMLLGLSDQVYPLPVTIKDFTLFSVMTAAFADGSYVKSGLEAWNASVSQPSVSSSGYSLTSNFGLMILQ